MENEDFPYVPPAGDVRSDLGVAEASGNDLGEMPAPEGAGDASPVPIEATEEEKPKVQISPEKVNPQGYDISELALNLQVPRAVVANNPELAREVQNAMFDRNEEDAGARTSPVVLPSIDYGVLAERFGLDRSVGTLSSDKTKGVLRSFLEFSEKPQDRRRTSEALLRSVNELSKEDPELAKVFRDKYLNYMVNPEWEPGLFPMDPKVSAPPAEDDRLGRFARASSLGVGAAALAGAEMERWGFKVGPQILHALTRPASLPWAVYAGIDEKKRRIINAEVTRRDGLDPADTRKQLGLPKSIEFTGAENALKSVLSLRDAQNLGEGLQAARAEIEQLKSANPQAAKILGQMVDDFHRDPARVPALLAQDELSAILDGGSSFENYVSMASALADSAVILSWFSRIPDKKLAAGTALILATVGAAAAGYRGVKKWREGKERDWYANEAERRRLLEYRVDEQGNPRKE